MCLINVLCLIANVRLIARVCMWHMDEDGTLPTFEMNTSQVRISRTPVHLENIKVRRMRTQPVIHYYLNLDIVMYVIRIWTRLCALGQVLVAIFL